MLGFGKTRKATQALIAAIQSDGKRVREHLAAQSLFASEHLGITAVRQWDEPYSRAYIFGALESLLEDRVLDGKATGAADPTLAGLLETGFVSVTTNAFGIGTREAHDALADIARRRAAAPVRHAIADGRGDGLRMRHGVPALLWLAHCVEVARREGTGRGVSK